MMDNALLSKGKIFSKDLLITSIGKYLCFIFAFSLSILQHLQILFPVAPSFSIFSRKTPSLVMETSCPLPQSQAARIASFSVLTWKMLSLGCSGNLGPDFHTFSSSLFVLECMGGRAASAAVLQPGRYRCCGSVLQGWCWGSAWGEAQAGCRGRVPSLF